jgi:hypothetical protein
MQFIRGGGYRLLLTYWHLASIIVTDHLLAETSMPQEAMLSTDQFNSKGRGRRSVARVAVLATTVLLVAGAATGCGKAGGAGTDSQAPAVVQTTPAVAGDSSSVAPDHAALPLAQRITDWWSLTYTVRDYDPAQNPYTSVAKPALGDSDNIIVRVLGEQLIRACRYDTAYADGVLANGSADPLYPPAGSTEETCPKFLRDGSILADKPSQTGTHREYQGVMIGATAQTAGTLTADWTQNPSGNVWIYSFTAS